MIHPVSEGSQEMRRSAHPEALAVGDPQDLLAQGADVGEINLTYDLAKRRFMGLKSFYINNL